MQEKLTDQQLRVVMGDFNTVTNSSGLYSLRNLGLRDSFFDIWKESEISTLSTNWEMDKRIDMIWLDSTLKANSAKIVDFTNCTICREESCQPQGKEYRQSPCLECVKCSVSDHLAVVVEIQ